MLRGLLDDAIDEFDHRTRPKSPMEKKMGMPKGRFKKKKTAAERLRSGGGDANRFQSPADASVADKIKTGASNYLNEVGEGAPQLMKAAEALPLVEKTKAAVLSVLHGIGFSFNDEILGVVDQNVNRMLGTDVMGTSGAYSEALNESRDKFPNLTAAGQVAGNMISTKGLMGPMGAGAGMATGGAGAAQGYGQGMAGYQDYRKGRGQPQGAVDRLRGRGGNNVWRPIDRGLRRNAKRGLKRGKKSVEGALKDLDRMLPR